jgi:endonuclease-8
MPEGDTIFRAARRLHEALAGRRVTSFDTVFPTLARVDDQTPLKGRTIEAVRSVGKHLIIDFSGDLSLRTHMRMSGIWHLYRAGERWRKRRSDMRLMIATDDYVAVGFNVPVAEFQSAPDVGPDLLSDDFDPVEAVGRVRQRDEEEIGNVLLNQRVVAGIGNIYKSEALFSAGVNPFTRVSALSDETLAKVVKRARALLQRSAKGEARPPSVYSRGGEPCRRCGAPITYKKQGSDARGTYWCPKCQA